MTHLLFCRKIQSNDLPTTTSTSSRDIVRLGSWIVLRNNGVLLVAAFFGTRSANSEPYGFADVGGSLFFPTLHFYSQSVPKWMRTFRTARREFSFPFDGPNCWQLLSVLSQCRRNGRGPAGAVMHLHKEDTPIIILASSVY